MQQKYQELHREHGQILGSEIKFVLSYLLITNSTINTLITWLGADMEKEQQTKLKISTESYINAFRTLETGNQLINSINNFEKELRDAINKDK